MNIATHTVKDIFNTAFLQKERNPFLVLDRNSITYGELKSKIKKLSTYYRDMGIRSYDKVLISSSDEGFICCFYLALIANGITAIFIDPASSPVRANAIIKHCDAKFIFIDIKLQNDWGLTSNAKQQVIPIFSELKGKTFSKLFQTASKRQGLFPACVDVLPESELPNEINPEADAYILFTSGTTSAPKGVRISFRALFSHLNALSKVYQTNQNSRIFNNLILSHADGMIQGPMLALFNSCCVYRPYPFSIQKIEDIFDVIYRENISHWVMVPTMISLIYQLKQNDPDTLRNKYFNYVISCGGKLETDLWQKFEQKFETRIINGYGLTETVAGGLFAGPEDDTHIIGSIGKPVDCEAKIMNEDNLEQPAGHQGEIWLRGSLIMSGYYNAPEETNEIFFNNWLRTGDIGYIGNDGCFRITGRKKLIIISGGVNISPEEVTEIINKHPDIQESVAFGMEESTWGEVVACAIVRKEHAVLTKEELIAHCRLHMEERKIPVRVFFMEEFPYGRSGKADIKAIKEKVSKLSEDHIAATDKRSDFLQLVSSSFQLPINDIHFNMIAEETPEWDSISHLILISELEKHFAIEFSPLEIMNIKVLSEMFSIVKRKINE